MMIDVHVVGDGILVKTSILTDHQIISEQLSNINTSNVQLEINCSYSVRFLFLTSTYIQDDTNIFIWWLSDNMQSSLILNNSTNENINYGSSCSLANSSFTKLIQ